MDVDEEIQPDEDEENSHLSIGVMSDIHEDDADQSMNSDEEQQLNEHSNFLDQRADNPLLSNEASEIDSTIEVSQLPSSSEIGLKYECFQSEDPMTLNQKGTESNKDGKYQIEDIQMESSNMSCKLDDDNTYMSTDMKEGIESPSSDISMSSEREIHTPVIDNEKSNVGLNNLNNKEVTFISTTKLDKNLILEGKSSNVDLHDSGVSHIEENTEVSQIKRNGSRLKEKFTGNLQTVENTKDTDMNASQTHEINDEIVKSTSQDRSFGDNVNENKDSLNQSAMGVNISDDIPTNIEKLNENSELHRKNDDEMLEGQKFCNKEDLQEKEIYSNESEIKIQMTSVSEISQNKICEKENTVNKEKFSAVKSTSIYKKFNVQEKDESTLNTPVKTSIKNINNDNMVVASENLKMPNKPMVENETFNNSDENLSTNYINLNNNQSAERGLLTGSNNDDDLLSNPRSLVAIQKLDEGNFNGKVHDFSLQESKNLDIFKIEDASLQRQGCDTESEIVNNAKLLDENSSNLSEEAAKLSMVKEIKNSEHLENYSEDYNKVGKGASRECSKINTTVLHEYSDTLAEEFVLDNEPKDKNVFDKSSCLIVEAALPVMSDEVKKDSKNLDKCPDDCKETLNDKGSEIDKHVLGKHNDDFTQKTSEDVVNEETKNEIKDLGECSDKLIEEMEDTVMGNEPKDKQFFDGSSTLIEEVQSVKSDEVEKDPMILDECSDVLCIEAKEAMKDKESKPDAVCLEKRTDDYTNKASEDVEDKKDKNEVKALDECSENIKKVGKTLVIGGESNCSDNFSEDSKDIENDAKTLDECSGNFTEVEEENVAEEEVVSESHSNSHEPDIQEGSKNEQRKKTKGDSDSDSSSVVDITDYLINFNKRDYISTPDLDLISEDSMSSLHEEGDDEEKEKTIDAKSPTEFLEDINSSEAELNSLEDINSSEEDIENESVQRSPEEHDNTDLTQKIERDVIKNKWDRSERNIESSDNNSDKLELTSENESFFEIIDEVNEEDTKRQWKKITTEGLARSSKIIFTEEPGKEIENGSFTRVVIVGDSFIESFIKMWPKNSKIKPYFLYKNKITLNQVTSFKIEDHAYLNNSEKIFVLFICGLHELSFYSTFKFHGCRGTHQPFKYIRKVEKDSQAIQRYFKEMTILKERLENNNGVFVAFCYLPVIDMGNICPALSELCRSQKNFTCPSNFSHSKSIIEDSINSICDINRNIFYRNLNETKVKGIFEFSPVNITLYIDRWHMYSKRLRFRENSDILSLSHLLNQYVYTEINGKTNINMRDSKMYLPTTSHSTTSDTCRVLIIGDTWIKYVADNWDAKLNVKPYFYCKNGLTLNCVQNIITSVVKTGTKVLIIASIPSGEFLTMSKFSECKDHNPLEYPVPHLLLLKDPLEYAEYVAKKLDLLSLNVQANKLSKIVFLTCYPTFFKYYYESIYEKHVKDNTSHKNSKTLEDMHDCSEYDTKVVQCFREVNKHAAALNKEIGIATCNVFLLMQKLAKNHIPVFPTEAKSIPSIQKNLLQLLERYACSLYNGNIFGTNDKSKIDEKNVNKETISDIISKGSEIKVKIENKSVHTSYKSENRIVIIEDKKKKSSTVYEKPSHHPSRDFHRNESSRSYHHYKEESPSYSHHEYHMATSDRYGSHPKHSRDYPVHGRKMSYTRSRSNDRRHSSRSYDRRYSRDRSKDMRHIKSRSKDRIYNRNRSIDRTRSVSKSRNRNKRHISRSRSPYGRHHESEKYTLSKRIRNYRSKSRSKSKTRPSGKQELSRELTSLQKDAIANLWESHSREREMYRKNPANHPDHDRVKRMWLDIMKNQGLNILDPSVLQCWWEYWLKKMENILETSWEEQKEKCLAVLSAKRKTSKSPNSSSSNSDYEYSTKRGTKKKKVRRKSPSRSKFLNKLHLNDDEPSSVEEIENLLQDFVKKNSKSYEAHISNPVEKRFKTMDIKSNTSKESQNLLDVVSILCQISDKFGALGMSLTLLHEKAVECVRNNLNPYNCIDEDAKMLLGLIKDKVDKILEEDSDMTFVQRTIVQEAHDRLVPFLKSFNILKKSNLNVESVAKATMGLQASDVISFIREVSNKEGNKNISNQELMDIYLQVKTCQVNIFNEKNQNILSDISKPSSSRDSSFFF